VASIIEWSISALVIKRLLGTRSNQLHDRRSGRSHWTKSRRTGFDIGDRTHLWPRGYYRDHS
jgi:hypothetical protein